MTKDGLSDAVSHLSEAVDIEPDFANAYAQLGQCHCYIALNGWVRPVRNGFEEAKRLGEEAVRLAASSPQTNYALAHALAATGQTERAITAARRAIDLNPNFAEAYAVLGLALVFFGETEEGLTACLRAARSNPRDARGSLLFSGLGHAHWILADHEQAVEVSKKGLHGFPTNYGSMVILAVSHAYLGHEAEARSYVDDLLRLIPRFTLTALRKNPMFMRPEHIERLVEGMRLAGLPE